MDTYSLYINGAFVASSSPHLRDIIDPANGTVIARVPDADARDVDAAVRAARAAFDTGPWRTCSARDRGRLLLDLARIIRGRAVELSELETINSGKPIAEAEDDVSEAAACFEYYGGLATKLEGDVLSAPDDALMLTLREPIGVAAQIIPWNFPLLLAAWKLAPALCAGCAVVLKPAEQTPLTVLALAASLNDVELPPGVVNIITGSGVTGAALVAHPGVDKVAFTGSPDAGRQVMRSAAETLKKVSLELGGKSPSIFFVDADFESAIEGALFGIKGEIHG